MTSIAGTNVVYPVYRNAVVGSTNSYNLNSTGFYTNLTTATYGTFVDNATVTPDDAHAFISTYATAENPLYAVKQALSGVGLGATITVAGAGVVTASPTVFTTTSKVSVLNPSGSPGADLESYIIFHNVTAATAATAPVLVHFGLATGLPLAPNDADVTVVYNASGVWRF